MVDCINRCPEVDTTIPKRDRARIEWVFDVIVGRWAELGIVDGGVLTELGVEVLPDALAVAWA